MKFINQILNRFRADESANPDVILDILFEDGLLFILLKNIGQRPAYQVITTFDAQIHGPGGARVINGIALFHKLSFLPPGREIRTFMDNSAAYFARSEPTRFKAHIQFQDHNGRKFLNVIPHDLEIYREIAYIPHAIRQPDCPKQAGDEGDKNPSPVNSS